MASQGTFYTAADDVTPRHEAQFDSDKDNTLEQQDQVEIAESELQGHEAHAESDKTNTPRDGAEASVGEKAVPPTWADEIRARLVLIDIDNLIQKVWMSRAAIPGYNIWRTIWQLGVQSYEIELILIEENVLSKKPCSARKLLQIFVCADCAVY